MLSTGSCVKDVGTRSIGAQPEQETSLPDALQGPTRCARTCRSGLVEGIWRAGPDCSKSLVVPRSQIGLSTAA